MTKSQPVPLTRAALAKFGVLPDAGSRALAALEREGLVTVERRRGRLPRVTILTRD